MGDPLYTKFPTKSAAMTDAASIYFTDGDTEEGRIEKPELKATLGISDLEESAIDITSTGGALALDQTKGVNAHEVTENTTLTVPDFSGKADGSIFRCDLFLVQDGINVVDFTGWEFAGATDPVLSTGAGDVDHLVVTIVKTAALGTVSSIGLAQGDISS